MNIPADLKYTKSHEWAKVEGESVRVGLSDYAQHEISDVVYVELPSIGQAVEAGKGAGVVESVKAAFNIYAPVSGSVVEINDAVAEDPSLVNQDPYGKGWLFSIKVTSQAELSSLMDGAQYEVQIKSGAME